MELLYIRIKRFIKSLFEKYNKSKKPKKEIYVEYVEVEKPKDEIYLHYKYNTQRDNKKQPYAACNVTSLQILLSKNYEITDDQLYDLCNSQTIKGWLKSINHWSVNSTYWKNKKLNQVYDVLSKAASYVIGEDGYSKYKKCSINDIKDEIKLGYGVLAGGTFTKSGHIVAIVGYNEEGLIVHDPWGNWLTKYRDKDGTYLVYPYDKLNGVLSGNCVLVHGDKKIKV